MCFSSQRTVVVAVVMLITKNTLAAVVIAGLTIYLGYKFYASRIDRDIIQSDPRKATPARMYMDGVDFVPASRSVLYPQRAAGQSWQHAVADAAKKMAEDVRSVLTK